MSGAEGLQRRHNLVCGKVPYRYSGGLPPVKHSRYLPGRPGPVRLSMRLYNNKSFEPPRDSIEAGLRKRKKEGLNLMVGSVRPGYANSASAANRCVVL